MSRINLTISTQVNQYKFLNQDLLLLQLKTPLANLKKLVSSSSKMYDIF